MKRSKISSASRSLKVGSVRNSGSKRGGGNRTQQFVKDEEPLPPALIRELQRRLRDSRDPVRYLLVSEFGRRFMLYYNVSTGMFAMNNPGEGTLFKRREAAEAVKKILSKGISIVKFTTKRGKLKRLSPYRGRWISRRGRADDRA